MSDVNDMLDSTLDDLEDLPSFEPFVPGIYRVGMTMEEKEVNGSQAIDCTLTLIEVAELAEPAKDAEKAPKVGDTCSSLFMLGNETGRGKFKEVAAVIGAALGTSSLREIVEGCTDLECMVVTSIRANNGTNYLNLKEVEVV